MSNPPTPNQQQPSPPSLSEAPDAQKKRSGLVRIVHAASYSLAGLRVGLAEPAFRQEAILACLLIPLAIWLADDWVQAAILSAAVFIVMITELLNTAVERTIDRIGPQWHALSKTAKDLGSAAVFLSLVLCAGIWFAAIYAKWF